MKLSIKAMALTCSTIWGLSIAIVGIANLIWPSYAVAFLDVISSVYPGYQAGTGFGSVIVGTLYAAIDGAVGGVLLAGLYNRLS